MMNEKQWVHPPLPTFSSSSPSLCKLRDVGLQDMTILPEPKVKKQLSRELSMREAPREKAWERRRKQYLKQGRRKNSMNDLEDLTDADLHELKGCIELGFGFNEENGQRLCNTLPALDLYFAVNRQLSTSPVSTPKSTWCFGGGRSFLDSPRSDSDSWKICNPEASLSIDSINGATVQGMILNTSKPN